VLTKAQVDELVERMLKSSGRRIDLSRPFVDAMLPDGHRLHVVLEGISRGFSAVNIRKFAAAVNVPCDLRRQLMTPAPVRHESAGVAVQCDARDRTKVRVRGVRATRVNMRHGDARPGGAGVTLHSQRPEGNG